MKRHTCKHIAEETLSIFDTGFYINAEGRKVPVNEHMERAIENTVLYTPGELKNLSKTITLDRKYNTIFKVENTTTLAAAEAVKNEGRIIALNFASAKNPGGGFLKGSQAQEESLARSSGLYLCLQQAPDYYKENRACRTCLYTDHMIYSPDVPVIRNDEGTLLSKPFLLSFLTAPAVNAGAVKRNEPHNVPKIETMMRTRADYVLAVCADEGHKTLILGAWGCGVFKNEPTRIAEIFSGLLKDSGAKYCGVFEKVIFAVLDRSGQGIISAFEQEFC
jgi:uncharacterized protein (TIGR02452 family)